MACTQHTHKHIAGRKDTILGWVFKWPEAEWELHRAHHIMMMMFAGDFALCKVSRFIEMMRMYDCVCNLRTWRVGEKGGRVG